MAWPLAQNLGGEEKVILGFLFFIAPVAGLASFLNQDTVSMTVQLFAGHALCAQEQRPKVHMDNVAEQLRVWETEACELTPVG